MPTTTGKSRMTLAGNPKHLFRIIQSIPSKKAKNAKLELEEKTGKRIVSNNNFKRTDNKKVLI